jgi:hypothetical protein
LLHRPTTRALAIVAAGIGLALAPVSVASAKSTSHHSACANLKTEEQQSSATGAKVSQALETEQYSKAKVALIKAYNADIENDKAAIALLNKAPNNVKSAFNGVIGFAKEVKEDIVKSATKTQLESELGTLGDNAQLQFESTVISNWVTKTCGSILPATSGSSTATTS